MPWTYHKIAALAPNSLILEKARRLAHARRWEAIGNGGGLLWGVCKSSGERVYHAAVRFGDEAFRCDCMGAYRPCRHVLALLMYSLRNADTEGVAPAWVHQMLKAPPAAVPGAEEKARREAERSQRLGQRLEMMEQGIGELEEWLLDLARHGLAAIGEQPASFWDNFAARMVDAKLGGLARRIRNFRNLSDKENRFELLLEEMASLYLLVQAFRQLDNLPEALQEDVLGVAGLNRKKEEVMQQPGIQDNWLAIGQLEGDSGDENLRYRRSWFLGERSGRYALILDFSWKQRAYDSHWAPGSAYEGELAFYPGAYPLRAIFRKHRPSGRPFEGSAGYEDIEAFAQAYAQALAANPWLPTFPCLLATVFPMQRDGCSWLVDAAGNRAPLKPESQAYWKLVAISGGRPLALFGEWDGKLLLPLSVIAQGRVIPLQGQSREPEEPAFNQLQGQ